MGLYQTFDQIPVERRAASHPDLTIPAYAITDNAAFRELAKAKGFDAIATKASLVGSDPIPEFVPLDPAIVKRSGETPAQRAIDAADATALRQRERQELADAVARKAPASELENHPMFGETVRQMEAIQPTDTKPGYLSPEWRATRAFDFDGEPVVGYAPAIARLTEGAELFFKGRSGQAGASGVHRARPARGRQIHARRKDCR